MRKSPLVTILTLLTASIWLLFGFVFKILGLVPRHRLIVAAVLGDAFAGPATIVIGIGETAIALWILSGFYPRLCAAVQTAAIVAMNTLEITLAKHLLLAPILMVCANTVLLIAAWYRGLRLSQMHS
ncbi:MAG TPA: DoxX-like family protein [Pyrinomonadaceae bacterium]|nr:DoxX-like family protein [Pyrinomonadaceae bacterium]